MNNTSQALESCNEAPLFASLLNPFPPTTYHSTWWLRQHDVARQRVLGMVLDDVALPNNLRMDLDDVLRTGILGVLLHLLSEQK